MTEPKRLFDCWTITWGNTPAGHHADPARGRWKKHSTAFREKRWTDSSAGLLSLGVQLRGLMIKAGMNYAIKKLKTDPNESITEYWLVRQIGAVSADPIYPTIQCQ